MNPDGEGRRRGFDMRSGRLHAQRVHTRVAALVTGLMVGVLGAGLAAAERAPNPWGLVRSATAGEPRAIGDYSGGCVAGARELPLDGEGYQVMHPSRRRHFGHPTLIDFVRELGRGLAAKQLGVLLIGDLSQPRGGRALGGHASHQSGLDVDIWYWHPKGADRAPLSLGQRESLKSRSVLDGKAQGIQSAWKRKVEGALQLTASDPRVARVFVHPLIKRELCERPEAERAWLRKIRPWYGHDDHFHVRLECPPGGAECLAQDPIPQGDGCDELDYWLSDEARAEREQGRKQYQAKVIGARKWPEACDAVLAAPEGAPGGESAVPVGGR
jgi:penicillin-insensitive murein endopeptidase